jgi:hypothetical protein
VKLAERAEQLEARAARVGKTGAISSDDPDAVPKLKAKLRELEVEHQNVILANKAVRIGGNVETKLRELGFDDARARRIVAEKGFRGFAIRNHAANVDRVRRRISELERRAAQGPKASVTVGDVIISEADNRVRVTFPAKPPEATRKALRRAGFIWAPSLGVWQRKANEAAWYAARRVVREHVGPVTS